MEHTYCRFQHRPVESLGYAVLLWRIRNGCLMPYAIFKKPLTKYLAPPGEGTETGPKTSESITVPTTSVRKCADTRKPPCKYLADLRDVFVKKKSELYKPPLRLYTTFQKY
ncbi:hypothetical protein OUZ56_026106 [Daphnia magna]|uniref:Uncharacterized protein n=1 Tax=Daphnia magna TaxID=35525 RepID=A0ABQ9ZKU3_9CRUS|nr:hypothetical protein OUZ56_026106 [Daphnia magna]